MVDLERARALALRYIDRRMRSRRELTDYLKRKHCASNIADAVADEMTERGYLDDAAYAAAFARDRVRLAPRGYRMIEKELRDRGVARETVRAALREVENEFPEDEVARSLLESRRRRIQGMDEETARRRVVSWLRGRGFGGETIRRVMDEVRES